MNYKGASRTSMIPEADTVYDVESNRLISNIGAEIPISVEDVILSV
ncbi:hypothetical protein [Rickettsiales endosymbiont of Peranema trichophorum]|nr:hypothetical protein [Rickettsiales endosymbiont of Peranema trichophorum]